MGDRSNQYRHQECLMSSFGWSLVETTAQLLEREQREAVLGDLVEAGESAWRGLLGILSLVFRLQAGLWKSWRPWLAAFGVSLPASLLLMGVSLSVSQGYQRLISPTHAPGSALLALTCQVLLLLGWSWSGGFVVGSLSRKTLWMSAALCCSPCLFCLARFRVFSLSRFCLLLFLLPAIWGVRQGLRRTRVPLCGSIVYALALTLLMIATWNGEGRLWWSPRSWILELTLIWPAWYMVATARGQTEPFTQKKATP
jgi:hypothetical protein